MPRFQPPPVLRYVNDDALLRDEGLVEFCCLMNLGNWEFVPEEQRSARVFHAMLRSPWNGALVRAEPIPPLVLQVGAACDCDNVARVKPAVVHSGYNLRFASERLRADRCIVAWAAAAAEVKAISDKDVLVIQRLHRHYLEQPQAVREAAQLAAQPKYDWTPDSWQQKCLRDVAEWKLECSTATRPSELTGLPSIGMVEKGKVATFFMLPPAAVGLLWPQHAVHCPPARAP